MRDCRSRSWRSCHDLHCCLNGDRHCHVDHLLLCRRPRLGRANGASYSSCSACDGGYVAISYGLNYGSCVVCAVVYDRLDSSSRVAFVDRGDLWGNPFPCGRLDPLSLLVIHDCFFGILFFFLLNVFFSNDLSVVLQSFDLSLSFFQICCQSRELPSVVSDFPLDAEFVDRSCSIVSDF